MDTRSKSRVLICTECKEEFVFTIAAQEYFAERGYSEDPKRCKSCHMQYKKSGRVPRPAEESVSEEF
ncbi:MAG: zinc-ribbon domain containing protein [candidate division Zixibacteria bacterium]|nr:zinc-ribbon domain containing protein [candidate division Zixibacteria bacterium]